MTRAEMARAKAGDLVEMLAAVDGPRADGKPEGVFSIEDMCEEVGRGRDWVRRELKAAKGEGRVEVVKVQVRTLDERLITVRAYKLKNDS